MPYLLLLSSLLLFSSCLMEQKKTKTYKRKKENIQTSRLLPQLKKSSPPHYPWHTSYIRLDNNLLPITKEHFRCKGSPHNPPRLSDKVYLYDCGGKETHSLPLRDNEEYIFPILLDLLNHLQKTYKKRVIVTSAHRCMQHQTYIDSSPKSYGSKHLIAAEVAFYVESLEEMPEKVVSSIIDYYAKHDDPLYKKFQRFEKETDTKEKPWYNKEIFIKQYGPTEGRDFDTCHSFPYISIQVRYDKERSERVVVSHQLANRLKRV